MSHIALVYESLTKGERNHESTDHGRKSWHRPGLLRAAFGSAAMRSPPFAAQAHRRLMSLGNKSGSNLRIFEGVDVVSDEQVGQLADALGGDKIDLLINNAGIMGSVTLENLDIASIQEQFEINAVAPLRVTHALLGHLSDHAKVGIVTSRMGSIDDNDSGGSYGYRMSKAAANMVGRSLSVDLKAAGH